MKKQHLLHFFPFLIKEFRKLEKNEIKSKEVFKELFPDEDFAEYKLKAIYEFQNCEDSHVLISNVNATNEKINIDINDKGFNVIKNKKRNGKI